MQDRLKYRIPFYDWDNNFIGFSELDIEQGIEPYNYGRCYHKDVEQCTGLKDKNGKLIYEGDIIKQGNSIYKVIFSYDDVASCGCCVGKFSGCGFVMEDKYGSRGDLDKYAELEVIGNIHENADLFKTESE